MVSKCKIWMQMQVINVKVVVATFNQEKTLVCLKLYCALYLSQVE